MKVLPIGTTAATAKVNASLADIFTSLNTKIVYGTINGVYKSWRPGKLSAIQVIEKGVGYIISNNQEVDVSDFFASVQDLSGGGDPISGFLADLPTGYMADKHYGMSFTLSFRDAQNNEIGTKRINFQSAPFTFLKASEVPSNTFQAFLVADQACSFSQWTLTQAIGNIPAFWSGGGGITVWEGQEFIHYSLEELKNGKHAFLYDQNNGEFTVTNNTTADIHVIFSSIEEGDLPNGDIVVQPGKVYHIRNYEIPYYTPPDQESGYQAQKVRIESGASNLLTLVTKTVANKSVKQGTGIADELTVIKELGVNICDTESGFGGDKYSVVIEEVNILNGFILVNQTVEPTDDLVVNPPGGGEYKVQGTPIELTFHADTESPSLGSYTIPVNNSAPRVLNFDDFNIPEGATGVRIVNAEKYGFLDATMFDRKAIYQLSTNSLSSDNNGDYIQFKIDPSTLPPEYTHIARIIFLKERFNTLTISNNLSVSVDLAPPSSQPVISYQERFLAGTTRGWSKEYAYLSGYRLSSGNSSFVFAESAPVDVDLIVCIDGQPPMRSIITAGNPIQFDMSQLKTKDISVTLLPIT